MKRILIGVVPLMFIAVPSIAIASDDSTTDQAVVQAKPKKVCRSVAVTGRRIGTSICRTPEQWALAAKADEENSRRFLDGAVDQQARSRFGSGPNGGTDSLAGTGMGVQ